MNANRIPPSAPIVCHFFCVSDLSSANVEAKINDFPHSDSQSAGACLAIDWAELIKGMNGCEHYAKYLVKFQH